MRRVASLGMYDAPALQGANDALWSAIADRLRLAGIEGVPDRLDRARPLEDIWADPNLLLAQTCVYPLATAWRDRLRYVATPRYSAPGCEGALHRSRIVIRRDDLAETLAMLRGRRVAVNDPSSNSGMNLLRAAVTPFAIDGRFFASVIETGSHFASAQAVASGAADVAAIDGITFAHLERGEPALAHQLRTLAWTAASPGLPLVTSAATTDGELRLIRRAIQAAIRDPANAADLEMLRIGGVEVLRGGRYDVLKRLEQRAVRRGYPQLA
ncbi:MAG: phosphate transporter substrate-binding protein [Sphingomonas bacterium]|nr:phosphate transporter substrate-binding protein [Sphingomonas bacterium]